MRAWGRNRSVVRVLIPYTRADTPYTNEREMSSTGVEGTGSGVVIHGRVTVSG